MGTAVVVTAMFSGCGPDSTDGSREAATARTRAVERYVAEVEPIRRAVDWLLERADPILERHRRGSLGPTAARARMSAVERRFQAYAIAIRRIKPVPAGLAAAHRGYADTYALEDLYLRALAAALPSGRFEELPRTADAQRAAIIAWRTRLERVAAGLGVRLPADVRSAGRGEIAPSPLGG